MTGGPCSGELRFWERVPSELRALTEQVARVADALEAMNASNARPAGGDNGQKYEPVPDDMMARLCDMAYSIGRATAGGRGLA